MWPIQNDAKTPEEWLKLWHMDTNLRVLNDSYSMNTNTTGYRWFLKIVMSVCLDEGSLSIERVNTQIEISHSNILTKIIVQEVLCIFLAIFMHIWVEEIDMHNFMFSELITKYFLYIWIKHCKYSSFVPFHYNWLIVFCLYFRFWTP